MPDTRLFDVVDCVLPYFDSPQVSDGGIVIWGDPVTDYICDQGFTQHAYRTFESEPGYTVQLNLSVN